MAEEVDSEAIEDMKFCYSIFDKVGDMKVDAADLVMVFRALGQNPMLDDINKIIDDAKMTGQRVDFETFFGIYTQYTSMKRFNATYEDLVEGWGCFDRDGSGKVNFAEMRNLLLVLGADVMTDEQIDLCTKEHITEGEVNYKPCIKKVMAKDGK